MDLLVDFHYPVTEEPHEFLKLDYKINLQRQSMIKIAITLWSNTEVKKKIDNHFGRKGNVKSINWYPIVQQVIKNLHMLNLPKKLHGEFEDIVIFIGEKIRNWMNWLVNRLGLDISFTRRIYWTDQGTIDESKIFQLYWQNNKKIKTMKECGKLPGPPLFCLAGIFAQEDFIKEHKKEFVEETNKHLTSSSSKIDESTLPFNIMYIWSVACAGKTFNRFSRDCSILSAVRKLPEHSGSFFSIRRQFVACAYSGYFNLINYFWGAGGTPTSALFSRDFFNSVISEFSYSQCSFTFNYEREKLYETILLLGPHYPDCFDRFMRRNIMILKHVLLTWPHQEFFLKLFRYASDKLTESEREELIFFIKCRVILEENHVFRDFRRKRIYNVLLKRIQNPTVDADSLMEQFLSA